MFKKEPSIKSKPKFFLAFEEVSMVNSYHLPPLLKYIRNFVLLNPSMKKWVNLLRKL